MINTVPLPQRPLNELPTVPYHICYGFKNRDKHMVRVFDVYTHFGKDIDALFSKASQDLTDEQFLRVESFTEETEDKNPLRFVNVLYIQFLNEEPPKAFVDLVINVVEINVIPYVEIASKRTLH